eukprot:766195-Hanusia_phi.AAC.4
MRYSYWKSVLLDVLSKRRGNLSVKDISQMTAFKPEHGPDQVLEGAASHFCIAQGDRRTSLQASERSDQLRRVQVELDSTAERIVCQKDKIV